MAHHQLKQKKSLLLSSSSSSLLPLTMMMMMMMMVLLMTTVTVTHASEGRPLRGGDDNDNKNGVLDDKNIKKFNRDVLGQAGFKKAAGGGRKSPSEKVRWKEERMARRQKERGGNKRGLGGGDRDFLDSSDGGGLGDLGDLDYGFGGGIGGGFAKKTPSEKAKWKEARKAARENHRNLSRSDKEAKRTARKLERQAQRAERERKRAERRAQEGQEL